MYKFWHGYAMLSYEVHAYELVIKLSRYMYLYMCTSSHNVLNKFAWVCIHTIFGHKLVLATIGPQVAHPWLEVGYADEKKEKMERKKQNGKARPRSGR